MVEPEREDGGRLFGPVRCQWVSPKPHFMLALMRLRGCTMRTRWSRLSTAPLIYSPGACTSYIMFTSSPPVPPSFSPDILCDDARPVPEHVHPARSQAKSCNCGRRAVQESTSHQLRSIL